MPSAGITTPTVYAVYRVLYGEDFIKESIKSLCFNADKIFICIADKPFGNTTGVNYKGQWISWPEKFDNVRTKIQELIDEDEALPVFPKPPKLNFKDRIVIIDDYCASPKNQLTHIVNDLILPNYPHPDMIIMMEPDHVFSESGARDALCFEMEETPDSVRCATLDQIEYWKTPHWRIPNRPNRMGPIIHRLSPGEKLCETGFNGAPVKGGVTRLYETVHNMGFCASPEVMYWKHLTALAFSKVIGDSVPNESWYEEKWLKWHPLLNNKNLEISLGYEWAIPYAYEQDTSDVPELIREKYEIQRE